MQADNPVTRKQQLRRRLREARRALAPDRRRDFDTQICDRLTRHWLRNPVDTVAGYLASDGEPDLSGFYRHLASAGLPVYLPVVKTDIPGQMTFRRWLPDQPLRDNRYGIPEPATGDELEATALQRVLTPLVGFTADGRRLGMGGGYYDRCFAHLLQTPTADSPLLGIAYQLQQVPQLPSEPWDIPLAGVITEATFIEIHS